MLVDSVDDTESNFYGVSFPRKEMCEISKELLPKGFVMELLSFLFYRKWLIAGH